MYVFTSFLCVQMLILDELLNKKPESHAHVTSSFEN